MKEMILLIKAREKKQLQIETQDQHSDINQDIGSVLSPINISTGERDLQAMTTNFDELI
jgi:hypothetical protein